MALIFRADLWECVWKQCHKTLHPWPRLRVKTFAARRRRSWWNSWTTWRWSCMGLKWRMAWLPDSPRSELFINLSPSLTRLRDRNSIRARSTGPWICGPRKHVLCSADSTNMKRTWKPKKQRGKSGCTYSRSTHLSIQGAMKQRTGKKEKNTVPQSDLSDLRNWF